MDPNACLRLILDSLAGGEREEAIEALQNLSSWLERGGFLPDWSADTAIATAQDMSRSLQYRATDRISRDAAVEAQKHLSAARVVLNSEYDMSAIRP